MGDQSLLQHLQQLWSRIHGYLESAQSRREVLIELGIIWLTVYLVLRYLRGTRGARAIKGMAMILIVATLLIKLLASGDHFERLNILYSSFLSFAGLALVVVFQPELRRLMVRLGEARFIFGSGSRHSRTVDEILQAVSYLARNKIGALIAIERHVGLKGIVEGGTSLDAQVSKELLNTIFWPGSALHDMGVIIQGDRIVAAGAQFPLAEGEGFDSELGSRHRAAIGLSQEADALVIVVSEETGTISLAMRGRLARPLTLEQLKQRLIAGLGRAALMPEAEAANGQTT